MAKHVGTSATTGRGIGLLSSLSSDWGIEATSSGKFVWFELDAGAAVDVGATSIGAAFCFDFDIEGLDIALSAVGGRDGPVGGYPLAPALGSRLVQIGGQRV